MRVAGAVVVAALVGCACSAPMARANEYKLIGPIVQRQGNSGSDFGYWGPQFKVTPLGSSVDTYDCPPGQVLSDWVVVGDTLDSAQRDFSQVSYSGQANQFTVHVTNWSLTATVYLRLAGSCTDSGSEFPYNPVDPTPGNYQSFWLGRFAHGHQVDAADYALLIPRAFCWSSAYSGCSSSVGTLHGAGRFALHNGPNTISLRFKNQSLTRLPAVRLEVPSGCRARRMSLSMQQRSGYLRLVLRCRGLKQGAVARVRITQPVRRSFRLRQGTGTVLVRLAKPPGTVTPAIHVAYGPGNKTCSNVRSRVRQGSRTVVLRVNARCGRSAGNAVAHLDIGGLLR